MTELSNVGKQEHYPEPVNRLNKAWAAWGNRDATPKSDARKQVLHLPGNDPTIPPITVKADELPPLVEVTIGAPTSGDELPHQLKVILADLWLAGKRKQPAEQSLLDSTAAIRRWVLDVINTPVEKPNTDESVIKHPRNWYRLGAEAQRRASRKRLSGGSSIE